MEVKIEKMDDLGRGITYILGKVTFVPYTITGDIVDITVTKNKKKYNEAKVNKFIAASPNRITPICPYFTKCGGCTLQSMSYENTITYKKEKVENIFNKNKIATSFEVVENPTPYHYRNKITLKIVEGTIGFYTDKTHQIVGITSCAISNDAINEALFLVPNFHIKNGTISIRCNQNSEILFTIDTNDTLNIDIEAIKEKIKLVGIVLNNKPYYGEDYLFERINHMLFKISYDSFFQVNPNVASKMFQIVGDNITHNDKVLDLYCGVGTFSLTAAKKAHEVVGIEIVPNAILNAIYNASLNDLTNVHFVLNDVSTAILQMPLDFTKVIVDPPRSGLDKNTIDNILKINPKTIIYISCDPQTLVRDCKLLESKYTVEKVYVLDMFSYTYHVECCALLGLKETEKVEEKQDEPKTTNAQKINKKNNL